jgi:antitoxin (DNA-binding transcriptional repressor) of toxin-antitoxin stability system
MSEKVITVTEAARNFPDCVNRAHYEGTSFVLLKNGVPFARIEPEKESRGNGAALAEALRKYHLPPEEAEAWLRDLEAARAALLPAEDKWKSS